jgi:hypothetical protein
MFKRYLIIAGLLACCGFGYGQTTEPDSLPPTDEGLGIDSTIDYDQLFDEMQDFLDSILSPPSYFVAYVSASQGYFNFTNKSNTRLRILRKISLSPTIGYYSKSGWGIAASGYMLSDSQRLKLFQASLTPSWDYLKDPDLAAGFAYTRYFTKDSLQFYTSPLQNEFNGYFLWRKPWLQPGLMANYGWGSRTEVSERRVFLSRLGITVPVTTTTKESVIDFSLTGSVRHDFYWLDIFSQRDFIRVAPMFLFTAGTQKFGFNQTNATTRVARNNVLYNAGNVNLDNALKFQPLSVAFYLRTEYSTGRFFIQPQFILDYYFPAESENLSMLFSLNAGIQF